LNDRRQGLFSHPARLQNTREVAACTKLGNAQPGGSCTYLPVSIAVAVTLGQSQAALVIVVLLLARMLACLWPALRAARVSPVQALTEH